MSIFMRRMRETGFSPPLAFAASTVMIDLLIEKGANVSLAATVSMFSHYEATPVDPLETPPTYVIKPIYNESPYSIVDYMLVVRENLDLARYLFERGGRCFEANKESKFEDICDDSSP